MNWLITGGCGFIGRALITRLLAEGGHRIRVYDNLSIGTRDDLAAVAAYGEGEALENPAKWRDGAPFVQCKRGTRGAWLASDNAPGRWASPDRPVFPWGLIGNYWKGIRR